MLLIAGAGEVSGGRSYRDAAPQTTALWELAHVRTPRGLAEHRAEWTTRVNGFPDSALRP